MKLLLTSAGIKNTSINDALVELLGKPIAEVTPLHLNREWARLLKSGGHTRKTKSPRSLSAKTVKNIAGRHFERIRPRNQVGASNRQSRHQLGAAQG